MRCDEHRFPPMNTGETGVVLVTRDTRLMPDL
jgi:hypothetical protein